MPAPSSKFEDISKEVAEVWHDLDASAVQGASFGLGHRSFAEAITRIAPHISPLEDPASFFEVLEAYADDRMAVEPDVPPTRIENAQVCSESGRNAASVLDYDIATASEMLAAGEVKSEELTTAALGRLEKVSSLTNAALALDAASALMAAQDSDRRRKAGQSKGPLDGIPLAHKGLFYRNGLGVNAGGIDTSDLADRDTATAIRRLESAGAVTIARLHLTEASFVPTGLNAHLGDCLNPWDLVSVTGGSSSGSAVACATSAVFGALGSDTGGSIRIPAAICGVTGLKPTYGRVSRSGAFPVSYSHDHIGPLARSASDCAVLYNAISGRDDADPTSSMRRVTSPGEGDLKDLKIGVARGYFHDRLNGDLAHNIDESLQVMREAGAEIIETPEADYELINSLSSMIIRAEVSAVHLAAMKRAPDGFSPALYRMLLQGVGIPYVAYDHGHRMRGALLKDFVTRVMADVDMLHLPVMGVATPTIAQASPDAVSGPEVAKELTVMMRPFNYLGLPCLSLPCGLHTGASGAKLPQGFQLVGKPFSEARLLEAGIAYQAMTDWHRLRPRL